MRARLQLALAREARAQRREERAVRTLAAKVRICVSAAALSVLAAVGSYAGTYRAMELLFTPAVVAPLAAVTPADTAALLGPAPGTPPASRPAL